MDQTRSRNYAGLRKGAWRLAALSILTLAGATRAQAQVNISASQTTPVFTNTVNNGAPSDIVITSAGSINPTSATAVTINSNNSVNNQGSITINNVNSVSGIFATGGNTGTITNSGTIAVEDNPVSSTPPYTSGQFRFGIQVGGNNSPFNGTITQTAGSITVVGNNSAGIDVESGLGNGGSINITGGAISVTGANAYGILANGAIGGGVSVSSTVTALGQNAFGIGLNQSVGTQVYLNNTISATGFNSVSRPTTDAGFQALVAADLTVGGNGVYLGGSVGQGVEVDTAGNIESFGSAAALQISPLSGSTVIGSSPNGAAGLQILGKVSANGVYDNFAATGVQVGGPTAITGGINISGSVTANAYAANATALAISGNALVPTIVNTGTISSTVLFGQGSNATIGGTATAIADSGGGAIISIGNQGTISATSVAGRAVAIDLSGSLSQVIVTQSASTTSIPAAIVGDVLFGSGNATLNLQSGTIKGNVAFGGGANNVFNITGGTTMTGALTTTGSLNLNAAGGTVQLTNTGAVGLTSLTIGSAGEVDFAIDGAGNKATQFAVSGATVITNGGKIGLDFSSKLTQAESFTIVQSQTLSVGSPSQSLLVGNVPFFYNVALTDNTTNGTISIAIRPRTASDAGIVVGSSAFNAIFSAFDRDPSIAGAFNRATSGGAFSQVYEQMLPDYAGGLFQALLDGTDVLTRAELGTPIYPLPGERTGAWLQEFGFAAERSRDLAPGYHGGGLGFAFGWENPLSKLTKLGYAVSYMRGSINDVDAKPDNAIGTVYAFGAYLKRDLADVEPGLKADAAINIGYAPMKSTRQFSGDDSTGQSFTRSASATWTGAVGNVHLGVSYEEKLGDVFVRPHVAADYFAMYEGSRTERNGGDAFDLAIASKTSTEGSGEVGLTIGTEFGEDFVWRPQLTAGWKQIFGGPASTVAQFVSGGPAFALSPQNLKRGGYFGRFGMHAGDHYTDLSFQAGAENFGNYNAFDGQFTARFRF